MGVLGTGIGTRGMKLRPSSPHVFASNNETRLGGPPVSGKGLSMFQTDTCQGIEGQEFMRPRSRATGERACTAMAGALGHLAPWHCIVGVENMTMITVQLIALAPLKFRPGRLPLL